MHHKCIVRFYSCEHVDCLPRFFLQWKSLHPEDPNLHCIKYVKPRAVIYTILCWLLILIIIVSATLFTWATTILDDSITAPLDPETKYIMIWKVIICLMIQTLLTFCWVLPMGLFYAFCIIIYSEFKDLYKMFRSLVSQDGRFTGCIKHVRMRHKAIPRMLVYADNFLKITAAVNLMADIIFACLILYNVFYHPGVLKNPVSISVCMLWLLASILNMLVISVDPAYVNQEVSYVLRQHVAYCSKTSELTNHLSDIIY